jgi:hypothetical protein
MSLASILAPLHRAHVRSQGEAVTYHLHTGEDATVTAFVRGVRADDLFGAAMQLDVVAILDASEFVKAFPTRARPARMDRVRSPAGQSYTVQECRASPEGTDAPVLFKLLVRGGGQ